MVSALALGLLAQASLPPPAEADLQPPMSFTCGLATESDRVELAGRISRFRGKAAPGPGLIAIADAEGYSDHLIVQISPSPLPGLAGRYEVTARFPTEGDRMVMTLPPGSNGTGYRLTVSPMRFGQGYQPFTHILVERRSGSSSGALARDESWSGSCTTVLPQSGNSSS